MHEIQVRAVSAEEAAGGIAELWAEGRMIAITHIEDGELKLCIEPRHGETVVLGVRSLTAALAEVDRLLAVY